MRHAFLTLDRFAKSLFHRPAVRQGRVGRLRGFCGVFVGLCLLGSIAAQAAQDCTIDHPDKFGIGAWPVGGAEQLQADLEQLQAPWFYTWRPHTEVVREGHVPMIWSGENVPDAQAAQGEVLLAFNEPDQQRQANMSVEEALSHWPALMATGKRLGSPAASSGNELGKRSWLGRFMSEAERSGYRVDFIAVHYYTTDPDPEAFRRYLNHIHLMYSRPIWVTEWALADWSDRDRFSEGEQRDFFENASEMLDDLPVVERHAWFGIYDGLDGVDLGSSLVEDGGLTSIGKAFLAMVTCGKVASQNIPAVPRLAKELPRSGQLPAGVRIR